MKGYGLWNVVEDPDGGEHAQCPFCGVEWCLNDGTPEDNEMFFCPKCGHDMREDNSDAD